MNIARRMPSVVLAAVLALPAVLGGCRFPLYTGNDIQAEQVKKIEPGKTTKQELLALFGAPMGIAIQNETMAVLAPTEWRSSAILSRRSYEVQGDTLFELFSVQHAFTEYDRVYYFYEAKSTGMLYFCLFYMHQEFDTEVDRLWVLMNEKTGIVEDYVYREHTHVHSQTQDPTPEAAPARSVW